MSEKGSRLKMLREYFELNQTVFAKKLGTGQASIARFENGAEIGKNVEFKILSILNVNPVWWETGEGKMFLKEPHAAIGTKEVQENLETYISGPRSVRSYILEDLVKVPLLDISARAGFVENLDSYSTYITDFTYVLPEKGERYDNALAMRIDGDSMEPRLERGDVVLAFFQEKSEWEYLNPGIYAVVYRNSFVIKRIKKNTLQNLGVLELVRHEHYDLLILYGVPVHLHPQVSAGRAWSHVKSIGLR